MIQIKKSDISYIRCKGCYHIMMFHFITIQIKSKGYFICPICDSTVNIRDSEAEIETE
jgi:hypothetical protein